VFSYNSLRDKLAEVGSLPGRADPVEVQVADSVTFTDPFEASNIPAAGSETLTENYQPTEEQKTESRKVVADGVKSGKNYNHNAFFAQYIYHDIRSQASTGNIRLTFDPYVLPSFPVMLFEQRPNDIHKFGMLVGGTHVLGPAPSTTITISNKRTLASVIQKSPNAVDPGQVVDADNVYSETDMNPAEPFPFVAENLQKIENANAMYLKWFYPNSPGKRGAVDYRTFLDHAAYIKLFNGELSAQEEANMRWDSSMERVIRQPDELMKYKARPVVTIHDYVKFMGSEATAGGYGISRGGSATYSTIYEYTGAAENRGGWTQLLRKYKELIGFSNEDPDFVKVKANF
jgi:hypothetical protein